MIICTSTIYHSTRIISNFNEALHPLDYPNDNKDHKKPSAMMMICTLFTGQPVRRAFLCVIVMSLN